MIRVIPSTHSHESFVVHSKKGTEGYVIRHISKRIFELSRNLMKSSKAEHSEESEGCADPFLLGVLVHEKRYVDNHDEDTEGANLCMREGEGYKHDFSGMVVEDHAVTEELVYSADYGRSDFAGASCEALSGDKLGEPVPNELSFC